MASTVIIEGSLPRPEMYQEAYDAGLGALRSFIREGNGQRPKKVTIAYDPIEDDWVITFDVAKPRIERLRRITGYLSNLHNFNYSKSAEEKDRVKHANVAGE
jgi:hypothetical protein